MSYNTRKKQISSFSLIQTCTAGMTAEANMKHFRELITENLTIRMQKYIISGY